jgi:hypothetical protein
MVSFAAGYSDFDDRHQGSGMELSDMDYDFSKLSSCRMLLTHVY